MKLVIRPNPEAMTNAATSPRQWLTEAVSYCLVPG